MTKQYAISNIDNLIYYLSRKGDEEEYRFTKIPYDLYYLYGYYAAMFGESEDEVGGVPFPKELAPIPFTVGSNGTVYTRSILDLEDEGYYYDKPEGYNVELLFDGLNPEQTKIVKNFVDDLRTNYIRTRDLLALRSKLREDVYPELVGLKCETLVSDPSIIVQRFVHRLNVEGEDYQTYFNKIKKRRVVNILPGMSLMEILAENRVAGLGENFPVQFINHLPLKQFIIENDDYWPYVARKLRQLVKKYPPEALKSIEIPLHPDLLSHDLSKVRKASAQEPRLLNVDTPSQATFSAIVQPA